jgi:hypothetical protein
MKTIHDPMTGPILATRDTLTLALDRWVGRVTWASLAALLALVLVYAFCAAPFPRPPRTVGPDQEMLPPPPSHWVITPEAGPVDGQDVDPSCTRCIV